jgi:steroid delta-isomerase-like uncharacterized protein
MSAADNVAVCVRAVEVFNRNDLAAFDTVYAPGIVRHDVAGVLDAIEGHAGVAGFLNLLRQALPDLQIEVEEAFGSDTGDMVAMRLRFRGTHEGDLLGAPPTGRRISFATMNMYRIADGRIAETWQLTDWAGALRQVGAALTQMIDPERVIP